MGYAVFIGDPLVPPGVGQMVKRQLREFFGQGHGRPAHIATITEKFAGAVIDFEGRAVAKNLQRRFDRPRQRRCRRRWNEPGPRL